MKKSILTSIFTICVLSTFAQVDSVSFSCSNSGMSIYSTYFDTYGGTGYDQRKSSLTIRTSEGECNYVLSNYSELTATDTFYFKRIKDDIQESLLCICDSLLFDEESDYYVFYFRRTQIFYCPENNKENKFSCGIGVYIVFKVNESKVKLDIKTPYDILAAAHLGLIKAEFDVRTFGMDKELENEFMPESLSKVDIATAKYLDKVMNSVRTQLNDLNTNPIWLPYEQ